MFIHTDGRLSVGVTGSSSYLPAWLGLLYFNIVLFSYIAFALTAHVSGFLMFSNFHNPTQMY